MQGERVKLLVIAGGGAYGIVPATFLRLLNYDDIKNVDVFGGTSVGGILSMYLAKTQNTIKMHRDFSECAKSIFKKSVFRSLNPFLPKYDERNAEREYQKIYGNAFACDCISKFIVPVFNFKIKKPVVFHNLTNKYAHYELWKIARATSAAPTFFSPFSENMLIDGGILENLPIVTSVSLVCRHLNKKPSDLDVLAIGTGQLPVDEGIGLNKVSRYTMLDWARQLLPILATKGNEMMSGLWGENMGFHSFQLFNPVVMDSPMDDLGIIECAQQKCELYYGSFLEKWKKFIE